jgi:murein DD-endopeptidase MepM/ murein hydrolase activator NlpD
MFGLSAGPPIPPEPVRLPRPKDSPRPDLQALDVIMPIAGDVVSPYGLRMDPVTGKRQRHKGLDFRAPVGASVRATDGGVVVLAGWQSERDKRLGFGLRVAIDHGGGNRSIYGHLSALQVKVGDAIQKGEVIGSSGNTGKSMGPHLHYEERYKGRAHPPMFRPAMFGVDMQSPRPKHMPHAATPAAELERRPGKGAGVLAQSADENP